MRRENGSWNRRRERWKRWRGRRMGSKEGGGGAAGGVSTGLDANWEQLKLT